MLPSGARVAPGTLTPALPAALSAAASDGLWRRTFLFSAMEDSGIFHGCWSPCFASGFDCSTVVENIRHHVVLTQAPAHRDGGDRHSRYLLQARSTSVLAPVLSPWRALHRNLVAVY